MPSQSKPERTPKPPRRILVRGVNWLGDAVMSTPALMRLRERFPEAHISLLTHRKLSALWLHHPAIDETIEFAQGEGLLQVGLRLRGGRFDLAVVLPNSVRSALEVRLAGIPHRLGYSRQWRDWLLNLRVADRPGAVHMHKRTPEEIKRLIGEPKRSTTIPPRAAHHIHQYLHLVVALGANPEPLAPNLVVTDAEIDELKARLLPAAAANQAWFGLNPGAEYGPAKRWPAERFVAAAIEAHRRTGCGWIILGGANDRELADRITSGILEATAAPVANLAGKTTLRQLCAALRLCRVLLTNDTGPMHVAAALGTPVVVPFGSTSPELTGPGLPGAPRHRLLQSDAPCSPCFLRECPIDFRCMNGISVERVVAGILGAARDAG